MPSAWDWCKNPGRKCVRCEEVLWELWWHFPKALEGSDESMVGNSLSGSENLSTHTFATLLSLCITWYQEPISNLTQHAHPQGWKVLTFGDTDEEEVCRWQGDVNTEVSGHLWLRWCHRMQIRCLPNCGLVGWDFSFCHRGIEEFVWNVLLGEQTRL